MSFVKILCNFCWFHFCETFVNFKNDMISPVTKLQNCLWYIRLICKWQNIKDDQVPFKTFFSRQIIWNLYKQFKKHVILKQRCKYPELLFKTKKSNVIEILIFVHSYLCVDYSCDNFWWSRDEILEYDILYLLNCD